MDEKSILKYLSSNFAELDGGATYPGTYAAIPREGLFTSQLTNRPSKSWPKAQFLYTTTARQGFSLTDCVDRWKILCQGYRDQFLIIADENDRLRLYDHGGKELAADGDVFAFLDDLSGKLPVTDIVAEDAAVNQFVRKCFMYFYSLDRFAAFWPATVEIKGWNNATFRTIKDDAHQIVFTGLFRADKNDDGQYFPEEYPLDGHVWYLPSTWNRREFAPDTNNRYGLTIQCVQRLVALYYPSYRVEIANNGCRLIRTANDSALFQSTVLSEFWNHVGKTVLEVDENFSKLPLYYHKGHIRVKTNYGAATNFSVGFYDADRSFVNKDVAFDYDKRADSNSQLTFYLDIETKDPKAFEKFIPVFNNTYQGLFEISIEGNNYTFRDLRQFKVEPYRSNKRRQVIYFGAPGTGKSFAVNKIVKAEAPTRNVRTTFHPDTDYSSFVGCFKPAMRDGKIEYAFTPQAFIKAYIGAWSDVSKPFYLIIKEINRGNCAQIFGDIFQLLDRNADGESIYGIRPDADLQAYIESRLGLISNLPDEIKSGEEMRLPANLFIYATMNTSDQSLFPIDSAFKRRWDMRYTAIKPSATDHLLLVGNNRYNWTSFIGNVNEKILDLTKSEDKQLGYWFIQPDSEGVIDWELFVSKAIFYIWNDVVKDYATMESDDSPFGRKFAFTKFFNAHGEPLMDKTIAFLDALGVEKLSADEPTDSSTIDQTDSETIDDVSSDDKPDSEEGDNQEGSSKDNTKHQI